jgi:Family of unknown function (DUF6627)
MRSALSVLLCRIVIVSLMFVSYQTTARMIETDQAIAGVAAESAQSRIQATVARADVARQLEVLGIDSKKVQDRVAALTDEEARDLADRLDRAPAGAGAVGYVLFILVLVLFGVWYWYRNIR